MTARRVVLWRHGRTRWNAERRFQGHSDIGLSAEGVEQAHAAAEVLARLRPDRIVSSDLMRAADTARSLSRLADVPVEHDERLRETYGGTWEGLTRHEIDALEAGALAAWAAGSDLRPGGGERRSEVADRMTRAIEDAIRPLPDGGVVVVVSHGGSSRAAIGSMLGLPVMHWGIFGVLDNCAWCVLAEVGGAHAGFGTTADVKVGGFHDVPPQPRWRLIEYAGASASLRARAADHQQDR